MRSFNSNESVEQEILTRKENMKKGKNSKNIEARVMDQEAVLSSGPILAEILGTTGDLRLFLRLFYQQHHIKSELGAATGVVGLSLSRKQCEPVQIELASGGGFSG